MEVIPVPTLRELKLTTLDTLPVLGAEQDDDGSVRNALGCVRAKPKRKNLSRGVGRTRHLDKPDLIGATGRPQEEDLLCGRILPSVSDRQIAGDFFERLH